MDEAKRFKNIAGYHVNTMKLIGYLEPISEPGKKVTDEELKQVIGESCAPGGRGYGYLASASRYILKTKRMIWSRVRQGGAIVCLNDDEKVTHCERERKIIHRRAKRTVQKLATVDTSKLTDARKTEHLALSAGMSTLAVMSSGGTTKKLIEKNASKPLEIGKALELMK